MVVALPAVRRFVSLMVIDRSVDGFLLFPLIDLTIP